MSAQFFDQVRADFGPLKQNQVDGLIHLLESTKGLPLRHRAYILATAWHETGPASSSLHMTPRREIWGPTEAQRRYEGRQDLGNVVAGDGKKYMGRGYVQITGRSNYAKASTIVGRDLVKEPDDALIPSVAGKIIVDGMTKGWFTGKKMGDYSSYKDMRRVVNGTDKADQIAGYAEKFEKALKLIPEETKPVEPTPPPPVVPPVVPPVEVPVDQGPQIAKWLIAAVGGLVAIFAAWIMKG